MKLISEKSGIADNIDYNHAKIRTDPYRSLPIEKILAFHNAVILIKSVVNKNKNVCCYILEKSSHKDKSNGQYFQTNVCIL